MTPQNPNMHNLKVFGPLVLSSTLQAHKIKFAHRARKCVFLGYKTVMKSTLILDINNNEIFVSRNLIHHELILPYQSHSSSSTWTYHIKFNHHTTPELTNLDQTPQSTINYSTLPNDHSTTLKPESEISFTDSKHSTKVELGHEDLSYTESLNIVLNNSKIQTIHIRQKHTPSYLHDYVCNSSSSHEESSSSAILYPIASFHSFAHLSS